MKYVKKPVIVEAFQFGVDEMPEWFLFDKDGNERKIIYDKNDNSPQLDLITRAKPGDYVFKLKNYIDKMPPYLFEDDFYKVDE